MTESIPKEHLFYKEGGKFNEELTKVRKTVSKSFENLPFSEKVAFLKKNVPPLKVRTYYRKCFYVKFRHNIGVMSEITTKIGPHKSIKTPSNSILYGNIDLP